MSLGFLEKTASKLCELNVPACTGACVGLTSLGYLEVEHAVAK